MSAFAIALGVATFSLAARARVRVCVHVETGRPDERELERLVRTEVDRHTTHQAVTERCEAHLTVEHIRLGAEMGGAQELTGRLDGEVPHRESIGAGGVAKALERLLSVVLHNDPRRLHGPEADDVIGRTRAAFLRRGTTYFGIELYQTSALVEKRLEALPGAALAARREIDRIHVAARIGAASALDSARPELRLSQQFLAQLEAALFSSADADSAWFGAVVLGLEYQRYERIVESEPDRRVESAAVMGLSPGLRFGLELLRTNHVRVQFFGQVLFPVFAARDDSRTLVDQWTPTASLGVGAWL
jgi:hypothetical protein